MEKPELALPPSRATTPCTVKPRRPMRSSSPGAMPRCESSAGSTHAPSPLRSAARASRPAGPLPSSTMSPCSGKPSSMACTSTRRLVPPPATMEKSSTTRATRTPGPARASRRATSSSRRGRPELTARSAPRKARERASSSRETERSKASRATKPAKPRARLRAKKAEKRGWLRISRSASCRLERSMALVSGPRDSLHSDAAFGRCLRSAQCAVVHYGSLARLVSGRKPHPSVHIGVKLTSPSL